MGTVILLHRQKPAKLKGNFSVLTPEAPSTDFVGKQILIHMLIQYKLEKNISSKFTYCADPNITDMYPLIHVPEYELSLQQI
jgi:hypothetical protein